MPMQRRNDRPMNVRALLESRGTPFTIARYRPREALFLQGDACGSVMYIEKGRVWLAVTTPSGQEAICGLLAAGAFLGEKALGGDAVRRQTAIAMTETEVLVVPKAQMIQLLRTQRAIADRFIAHDERRPCRCVLPDVSQEIIAEMVGTSRSRVNLFMGRFKKLGFLDEGGGVVHVHPSLLHVVDDRHPGRATRSPVTEKNHS